MAQKANLLEASRRAHFAVRILGAVAALHLVDVGSQQMHVNLFQKIANGIQFSAPITSSDQSRQDLFGIASLLIRLVAAVAYCRWLYWAYDNAGKLGQSRYLRGTPRDAVVSFFIPVLNLFRPFQHVRALWMASDPRGLPEVPPKRRENPAATYRDPPLREVPSPVWKPTAAPLVAWWAAWLVANLVIRAIDASQIERQRRRRAARAERT
jgi:hypothetical protein